MIHEAARAKLNLTLHVTGRRDDGYHLLDSLVVFVGPCDWLSFRHADTRKLAVTGPFAEGVPTGPENLIWRAIDLIDPDVPLEVTLDKRLPHGGGLGGGSSDAAAALRAVKTLLGKPIPDADRVLGLGADVPACLRGKPSRMRGIGEVLESAPPIAPLSVLLVNPRVPLATGDCFAALADVENPPLSALDWFDEPAFRRWLKSAPHGRDGPLWPPDQVQAFVDWLRRQRNDLEAPARRLVPEIGAALDALAALPGCLL
ncbi:MAG: 4-(cytidine 5'-diphospho)-2-C-methyl-D-erythritol kinase, partial [Pseudomonadota bacterium]